MKKLFFLSAALIAGCNDGPSSENESENGLATSQATFQWKLITTWPKNFPALGTAPEKLDRLSKSLQKALKDENVVARFAELGTKPSPEADATPAALKAKLEGEIARWKPVIEAAGQYAD